MKRTRILLVLALAAVLLILPAVQAGAAPASNQASGAGSFTANDNVFRFAFNARQVGEAGEATGQLKFHNVTNGNTLHLQIVRMTLEGDAVLLEGKVTKVVGANAEINDLRYIRLEDNGQGRHPGPDRASKLSKSETSGGFLPLDRGNVNIH